MPLISHLAQQMNQDALAYLESSPSRTAQSRQLPNPAAATGASFRGASSRRESSPKPFAPSRGNWQNWITSNLDAALYDDEITLLQLDNEISQLQI